MPKSAVVVVAVVILLAWSGLLFLIGYPVMTDPFKHELMLLIGIGLGWPVLGLTFVLPIEVERYYRKRLTH